MASSAESSRFPHSIVIMVSWQLDGEIWIWCNEAFGSDAEPDCRWRRHTLDDPRHDPVKVWYGFSHVEDLALFKLTWYQAYAD